ncbi:Ladderlectin [Labeo rohita]|uniref:Ladderlectin n=1 Tax=Labeo rohita TaxID=84645 RepID=A0ABQ8MCZ2_LABRO|nr:Ladderlectin [Labeo rohita]
MAVLRSLLLLFTVFSMGNAEVEKCPYGWRILESNATSSSLGRLTGSQQRNCQSLGASLASVHSKLENDFLLSLLPSSSTQSWDGEWMWSDGTPYDYTNWCSVEPNVGGSENCMEINWTINHCWNDRACFESLGYACATAM